MKPVILTFTALYLPGYLGGGPIRSISNMVERLGDEFDFYIFTSDRDKESSRPYTGIKPDYWNTVGKAKVFYASPETQTWHGIKKVLNETPFDLMYLNSFFSFKFSLIPVLLSKFLVTKKQIVLAPRGEFSPGAFELKKWKKLPFSKVVQFSKIYKNVIWHGSTSLEVEYIRRILKIDPEKCFAAPNISEAPRHSALICLPPVDFLEKIGLDGRPLRLCFLSRIAPKKNLDFALQVLGKTSVPVQFDIYGPQENRLYWDECSKIIERLPSHVQVKYCGKIEHAAVRENVGKYDIFFLPTRGENFGHVFIEAWSVGVPVLISDQTPWRDLEAKQLGWDIPLANPEQFVQVLENFQELGESKRLEIRQRCLQFANEKAEGREALDMHRRLFASAL